MSKDIESAVLLVLGCVAIVLFFYSALLAIPLAVVGFGGYVIYRFATNSQSALERKARQHTHELYNKAKSLTVNIPEKEAFAKEIYQRLPDTYPPLEEALIEATLEIYDQEYGFAEIPPPPAVCNSIEAARYRDFLASYSAKITNASAAKIVANALHEAFIQFLEFVPPLREGPAFATVPLSSFLAKPNVAIQQLIFAFYSDDITKLDLFKKLRTTLDDNLNTISGGPKNLIMPEDYEGENTAFVYLKNTPLLSLFDAPIPFVIQEKIRHEGHYLIAPQGRGKSTFLRYMLKNDFETVANGDASVIVMDSKGELIQPIPRLNLFKDDGDLARSLCLLEYEPDFPLALNPLDLSHREGDKKAEAMHTIDLLEYVFSSLLETKMTSHQSTLFNIVLQMLVETVPNPTIEDFRDVITNGYTPYEQQIRTLTKDIQDFFFKDFDTKRYRDTREGVAARLYTLLRNPAMRAMFTAKETKLDIGKEMDAAKVIVINNNIDTLGEAGAEFFGRFIIALVLAAARRRSHRSDADKLPCYFYIDECHTVISKDENIAKIIDQCRSQKIGMILAHQRLQQIKLPDVKDALANCAIRMANSDADAKELAPRFETTAEQLRSTKKGQFVTYVRDLTMTGPVTLTIPNTTFKPSEMMSDEEFALIRTRMRKRYSYDPREDDEDEEPPEPPQPQQSPKKPPAPTQEEKAAMRKKRRAKRKATEASSDWG